MQELSFESGGKRVSNAIRRGIFVYCAVFSIAFVAAMSFNAVAQERLLRQAEKAPFIGSITVEEWDGEQTLVTTCSAGKGESCQLFASNCIAANGYYDGDASGGTCCSGVDHPGNNVNSACN